MDGWESDDRTEAEATAYFLRLAERTRRPRGPARIGDIVNDLIARRGYMRRLANADFADAWRAVVGPELARDSTVGGIQGGVLDIIAADSALVQEFTFRKGELLNGLRNILTHVKIRNIRFRVGPTGERTE